MNNRQIIAALSALLSLGGLSAEELPKEGQISIETGKHNIHVVLLGDQGCSSLAGEWRFRLDPEKVGVEQEWFGGELPDTIQLPDAHSISDQAQGNWNGIAGRIELIAEDRAAPKQVRLYPNVADRLVRVVMQMPTETGSGTVEVAANGIDGNPHTPKPQTFEVQWRNGMCELVYPLGADARLWDEFAPNRYALTVADGGGWSETIRFGLREWGTTAAMLTLNGRIIQLRGTLECAIWPKTGHPPTDVESWRKAFQASRDFGLNHFRFHSWCPPEAAFEAADELGIYLQVECGVWSHEVGEDKALQAWIIEEAKALLDAYGNHPSFMALCIGNEGNNPPSRQVFAKTFLEFCRKDGRHLYTDFANTGLFDGVDFAVKPFVRIDGKTELARDKFTYGTRVDFSPAVELLDVPLVGHETTQIAVYPDFDEVADYTGPLKPETYEFVRMRMKRNGLETFGSELLHGSGALQNVLYKEYIEQALRTPDYAGYQMLGINDFSGQGMALVGPLNVFWEPKAYASAEAYRRFQGPVIPLARFDKRVWTSAETFHADLQLAHYGAADLTDQSVEWRVRGKDGTCHAEGHAAFNVIQQGGVRDLLSVDVPLAGLPAPGEYVLEVSLPKTGVSNDWKLWVFSDPGETPAPEGVMVSTVLNRSTVNHLRAGGRACLFADVEHNPGIGQFFSFKGVRWNNIMGFQKGKGGKGFIADQAHPMLSKFPTGPYVDWQWAKVMDDGRAVDLSEVWPKDALPTVMLIDNFTEARKLGGIFEVACEGGRLLVCMLDLNRNLKDRPAAAQLRRSLLDYAASDAFRPAIELDAQTLAGLLRGGSTMTLTPIAGCSVTANSEDAEFISGHVLDGQPGTFWHSAFRPEKKPLPHELIIQLPKVQDVDGLQYTARAAPGGRITEYAVYVSADGTQWGNPILEERMDPKQDEVELRFSQPVRTAMIRFEIRGTTHPPAAAVAELVPAVDLGDAFDRSAIDPTGRRQD